MDRFASATPSPEQHASNSEIRTLLEQSIDALPEPQRIVLVMRDVEEMSTMATAEALGITEENVKVRLHRARAILRRKLYTHASVEAKAAFAFLGARCDRVVESVLARIQDTGLNRDHAAMYRDRLTHGFFWGVDSSGGRLGRVRTWTKFCAALG